MNEWKLYSRVKVFSFTANGRHRLPTYKISIPDKKNNNDKKSMYILEICQTLKGAKHQLFVGEREPRIQIGRKHPGILDYC